MDAPNNRGRRHGGRRGRGPRRGPSNGNQVQGNGRPAQDPANAPVGNNDAFQPASTIHRPQEAPMGPNGPVPLATRRFAELSALQVHPVIVQTITEDMKFEFMTPVQAATLDELLPPKRHDCLAQARTGTGKTAAFLIPALQTMLTQNRSADSGISLLVVTPTRELALQICTEATKLLQRLPNKRVRVAIGGTNKDREEKQILGGCDILVATPGRLLDHMSNSAILHQFRNLNTLVLDEADRLLDMGFTKDLRDIVSKLPDKQASNRQGMLFSATIAPHVEKVAGLVLSPGYKFISTIPAGEANTHERVPQFLIEVPSYGSIAPAMVGCVREEVARGGAFKSIVFAQTAALADFYGGILAVLPGLPPVSILHSRLSQSRRTKLTNEFRDSTSAILVATDVVARGMDFPGVTAIIQVGIPMDKESYIHRLGRTARADAEGRGIFIVTANESWFPKWTLKDITLIPREANLSSAAELEILAAKMDEEEKAKIYRTWLGYYNSFMGRFRWDKEELVRQGNLFAREALGSPDTPPIGKSTAGKMGLRGVRGLLIVPDPPKTNRSGGGGGRGGGRGRGR